MPFSEVPLTLLEGLIAVVQYRDAPLKLLASLGEFINFRGRRRRRPPRINIKFPKYNPSLFYLRIEVSQLSFDVVKVSDLLGESTLKGADILIELEAMTHE
jgi:hypothetical protein